MAFTQNYLQALIYRLGQALTRFINTASSTPLHQHHWAMKEYHRALEQLCHIERFQVRGKQLVRNHTFAAIFGYTCLKTMKVSESLRSIYSVKKMLLRKPPGRS